MNGAVKSRRRLTQVALTAAHSQSSQQSMDSTIAHLLNKGAKRICQKRESWSTKTFFKMQCLTDQPLCKTLKRLNRIWFFLRSGILWITWRQQNDMVINNLQWHVEKTCQTIWDALQDYGRIEWKQTLLDLEKSPYIAYQEILNKSDSTWGGGGQRPYSDPEQLNCHLES